MQRSGAVVIAVSIGVPSSPLTWTCAHAHACAMFGIAVPAATVIAPSARSGGGLS